MNLKLSTKYTVSPPQNRVVSTPLRTCGIHHTQNPLYLSPFNYIPNNPQHPLPDILRQRQMSSAPTLGNSQESKSSIHSDDMPAFITPFPRFSHPRRSPSTSPRTSCTPTVAIAEPHIKPDVNYHGIPNPPPGTPLLLNDLRARLIRQEETIIFALIERAQFRTNPKIYIPGMFDIPAPYDFSTYLLYELEKVCAKVRRYTSPDEHPFAPPGILPPPVLEKLHYPPTLKPNTVNVNSQIKKVYRDNILPGICHAGDDQNYGSAATCDVACLQALSKRIHYGKFIAEAKCQENERLYASLARNHDREAIWHALSNFDVEQVLLKRVQNKATSYGSDITGDGPSDIFKVDPRTIADIYGDYIIPLTKQVEVDYIIQRYVSHNAYIRSNT